MVKCKYCGREFKNNIAFGAHKCEGINKERALQKQLKNEINEEEFTFICNGCGRKFKTLHSLNSHAGHCDLYKKDKHVSIYKIHESLYRCECGREFNNFQSLNAHLSHCDYHHECIGSTRKLRPSEINHSMCWENKSNEEIKEIYIKSGKTHSDNIKSGKSISNWTGKKHTKESKEKIRISTINYIINSKGSCKQRYNHNACNYIDKLNEEYGWNLQHAENGGEVECGGYWLDGYDKDLNIAFEYDEPKHYIDIENNILNQKDIDRQNYIIEKLHCKFYRYNEKMDKFYQVN